MAISELHASHIRRVKVGFVVSGEDLVPSEITDLLGVSPSHAANRGDPKINAAGNVFGSEPEGWWRIDSVPGVDSKDINNHLELLLGIVLPHAAALEEHESFFDVLWESTYLYAGTGPVLSARACSGIGRLGAGLGFDIYQLDEDA